MRNWERGRIKVNAPAKSGFAPELPLVPVTLATLFPGNFKVVRCQETQGQGGTEIFLGFLSPSEARKRLHNMLQYTHPHSWAPPQPLTHTHTHNRTLHVLHFQNPHHP